MPRWARYTAIVYFGLMMSGSLPASVWAKSPNPHAAPALVKSTQFAPLKQPYRYPAATDGPADTPRTQAPPDLLR